MIPMRTRRTGARSRRHIHPRCDAEAHRRSPRHDQGAEEGDDVPGGVTPLTLPEPAGHTARSADSVGPSHRAGPTTVIRTDP